MKALVCLIGFLISAAYPLFAQTPPILGVQLYAGVNIPGAAGAVYALQYASSPSETNWTCAALVQLPTTNYTWADTSTAATRGQRFYRAVLAATNFAYILPGTFTMGSPTNEALRGTDEGQHVVTLTKGFYMDKFLVTQAEYGAIVGRQVVNSNFPVVSLKWSDATNYCGLRTALERQAGLIPTNWDYRLPTESEWEYACRAGTVSAFYCGSTLFSPQANFLGTNAYNSAIGNVYDPSGVMNDTTTNVGNYAPNGWGLYDMAGNVDEWCSDWYGPYPANAVTDPQGPATGTDKARRGGRFSDPAVLCRSACRAAEILPNEVGIAGGFRVVLAPQ